MLTCFTLSAGIPVRGERVTEVRWQELLQMCKGQESLIRTLSLAFPEQGEHPLGTAGGWAASVKERWLCNSLNSLESAVPLSVCSQDKGEACSACFTELVRSGFKMILGDPSSHLLPCYLSSLRPVWKVLGVVKAQTTKKFVFSLTFGSFFWNFSISF